MNSKEQYAFTFNVKTLLSQRWNENNWTRSSTRTAGKDQTQTLFSTNSSIIKT
jgi:hypothetical protein